MQGYTLGGNDDGQNADLVYTVMVLLGDAYVFRMSKQYYKITYVTKRIQNKV